MARTTSAAVQLIIDTDANIVTATSLTPFIDVANELVTELCTPDLYTDFRLELIERWLAAHFYAIRDNRRAMESVGAVVEWFQYKLGLNLANTMYGQQVMMLDTNGGLAEVSAAAAKGGKVDGSLTHVGSLDVPS